MKLRASRQAFVLVAILVVIMLVSMVALSLLFQFKADATAVTASAGQEQAWSAAMSGVQEAMRIAAAAAPGSTEWQDNPRAFRDQFVFDDGSDRWYFTVFSPADSDSLRELSYGLMDEAGKLNINLAGAEELGKLPRFTPLLAAAVADFIDSDDTPLPEGAEQEYYDGLTQGYLVHNRRLDTLDELLLVRGFAPALLNGEDANLNGRLDPNENDGDERFPPDNNDGRLERGLRQYLTTLSSEPNDDNDGIPRTNINDPADPLPGIEFPAPLTNYIAALRTNRFTIAHPADLLEAKLTVKDDKGKEVEIDSEVGKEELPLVLDYFTATNAERFEGLINVNTASIAVLSTVPDIDGPLAESIASARRSISPERRTTLAWLYQEGVMDAEVFKKVAPHLTARSFQFSFRVVGYGVPSSRYRLLDVTIDLSDGIPRVAYLRDITRLGLPFKVGEGLAKEAYGG